MTDPTPRPWRCDGLATGAGRLLVIGADGYPIAYTDLTRASGSPRDTDEANAERIVRAVNAHDALLAAAEALRKAMTYDPIQGWHLSRVTADEIKAFDDAIEAARA